MISNKPTFLTLRVADNAIEYINTNHVLKATYTKTHDNHQALTVRLITGAILTYVVGSEPTDKAVLNQWLDFLEGNSNDSDMG